MVKCSYIYKVKFADSLLEYYFTSLAAIYEKFSSKDIGVGVQRLYEVGLSDGKTYVGKKAIISKEKLFSKAQNNPRTKIELRTNENKITK